MCLNKFQKSEGDEWMTVLTKVLETCPNLFKPFLHNLLLNLVANGLKSNKETCLKLHELIMTATTLELIDQTHQIHLMMLLLEHTEDLKTFMEMLTMIIDQYETDETVDEKLSESIQKRLIASVNTYSLGAIVGIDSIAEVA